MLYYAAVCEFVMRRIVELTRFTVTSTCVSKSKAAEVVQYPINLVILLFQILICLKASNSILLVDRDPRTYRSEISASTYATCFCSGVGKNEGVREK